MNEETNYCKIGKEFDIKEFVETNDDSAKRTRWITIVLVVATVIIFIGFYNSRKTSWATNRIESLKDFENIPENNDGVEQKPLLDVYFGKNDFKDFKVFACQFQLEEFNKTTDHNALSKYLFNQFNAKTKELLNKECSKVQEFSEDLVNFVNGDLNRILKDKFLYSSERFPEFLERKDETKYLLEAVTKKVGEKLEINVDAVLKIKDTDLIRLNRLLLEEAYREDKDKNQNKILESSRLIPDTETRIPKEIAKYIAFDDNVQFIQIPFFGIAIDVNDLGFIGAISLIIILLLLRYSQSREIKNLNISFKESFYHEKLCTFYHKLAMRQVLTVPDMEGETKNKRLAVLAKIVFLLPVLAIGFGVGYDYWSVFYYKVFEWEFVNKQLYLQGVCFVFILVLSLICLLRQLHIDKIWNDYYYIIRQKPSALKKKIYREIQKTEGEITFDKKLFDITINRLIVESEENKKWIKDYLSKKTHPSLDDLKKLSKLIDDEEKT